MIIIEVFINVIQNNKPYEYFLRILRRSNDSMYEDFIHEEIFSVERMEQFAVQLATEFKISNKRQHGQPLLKELKENRRLLLKAYLELIHAINNKLIISPAAEWLVDNYHIIEEQIKSIQQNLPVNYYLELPKLSELIIQL